MSHELILFGALVVAVQAAMGWVLRRRLRAPAFSWAITGKAGVALATSCAAFFGLFVAMEWDLDRQAGAMWGWIALSCILVGGVSGARHRRVPTLELMLATLANVEMAGFALFALGEDLGLTDPSVRTLLVAPAALALVTYFGASGGYLLWGGSEKRDLRFGYEWWVGRRFLLSKSSAVLSTVTAIALLGVALGVWLVIVALGVLAGFEQDLQKKIIGANAHILLQRDGGRTFDLDPGVLEAIDGVDGVVASNPFVQGEVAIASSSNYTGAVIFGVSPELSAKVLSVLAPPLAMGSMEALVTAPEPPAPPKNGEQDDPEDEFPAPAPLPGIVVGLEMQKALNVIQAGDGVRVISPLLERITPVGPVPASQGFRIAGVFSSEMYEFDARFAYAEIDALRRFFELGPRAVSGIQIRVVDPDAAQRIGERVVKALVAAGKGASRQDAAGGSWEVLDWKGRNQTLFAALKLERVVAFVVLVFIILVASFSIVNTLTMSVIEKQKEIAILKTMGARNVGIMKLFLVQGLLVGGVGTAMGTGLALVTISILKTFGFWIPDEVYYIDSLPVHLEIQDVVLVVLAALLIVWDFSVFPALRGSQLDPVEGLREG